MHLSSVNSKEVKKLMITAISTDIDKTKIYIQNKSKKSGGFTVETFNFALEKIWLIEKYPLLYLYDNSFLWSL